MARTGRSSPGGVCYHVLNRGNERARVFHCPDDYQMFLRSLDRACTHVPMSVFAYCLMPNHFHLVVQPAEDRDLGRWMQRLMTSFAVRYRCVHDGSGHIWSGRFKSFPVQDDRHLLSVLRYVERNPVRAGLATRAERWPWSSAGLRQRDAFGSVLTDAPVKLPKDWLEFVNQELTLAELDSIRESVGNCAPLGEPGWIRGAGFSPKRPRGRPPTKRE